ncbi:hypothetical protein PBI_KEPLER_30 [Arthrobacter phage Kepler]|uniref:Uncharacterized protein n=2 Tax=Coralvirus TaxID=2733171 RepID=A0A3G2KFA8_9CAUD|nr:hypothetical protein HOU55_gp30 [Arthrobacter phage Kepler]AYN57678.1 hypothetical protein PBI_DAOB_31 [Arthrobacter phage Daob]AYN58257.1 hypothetical protein PBI_KEPLER_30 [Arthrobacter phage Kepler]
MKLERDDLPRKWDGVELEWHGWQDQRTTLAYHLPVDQLACQQCGAVDEPLTNRGRRQFRHGVLAISGSSSLHASRCRHCSHDVVTDMDTEESWDLEPEDYGPDGSNPPEPETLF